MDYTGSDYLYLLKARRTSRDTNKSEVATFGAEPHHCPVSVFTASTEAAVGSSINVESRTEWIAGMSVWFEWKHIYTAHQYQNLSLLTLHLHCSCTTNVVHKLAFSIADCCNMLTHFGTSATYSFNSLFWVNCQYTRQRIWPYTFVWSRMLVTDLL